MILTTFNNIQYTGWRQSKILSLHFFSLDADDILKTTYYYLKRIISPFLNTCVRGALHYSTTVMVNNSQSN